MYFNGAGGFGMELRKSIREGRVRLPATGRVRPKLGRGSAVHRGGRWSASRAHLRLLSELTLADGSPLTSKSYAYDLLRWWRLLACWMWPGTKQVALRWSCWWVGCDRPQNIPLRRATVICNVALETAVSAAHPVGDMCRWFTSSAPPLHM